MGLLVQLVNKIASKRLTKSDRNLKPRQREPLLVITNYLLKSLLAE
jgi:hypothetical protein